ncbi:hypothetical protein, partial [Mucilaginibacter sp.]|uniref:hypothetical protein n=1 Tax=Mucilaginibacter sp. TaxID=1882438 RepID=UPI002617EADD
MKKIIPVVLLSVVFLLSTSFINDGGWEKLLDKDLSKWRIYQSFRHKDDYHGKAPVNEKGELISPIGYDKNEAQLVSVTMVNNEPVVRISGETYGCIFTKQEFQNY